jgi:transposase
MATTTLSVERTELVDLRQQAHFWHAQHARAVEREAAWKTKCRELQATVRELEAALQEVKQDVAEREATITEKDGQIEVLKAKVAWLSQRLFGRSTEQSNSPSPEEAGGRQAASQDAGSDTSDASMEGPAAGKRNRGQQKGAKGHGRKRRLNLPCKETVHDVPEDERRCQKCGKPYAAAGTEDSEEIEWDVRVYRRCHRRRRYVKTCDCEDVPGMITAPVPAKLFPKGMFSISFWVHLVLEKYLFQRPLHRILNVLSLEGLDVSQGTITGGLERIGSLLQPVYAYIQERNRQAKLWKMDETSWRVFVEVEGKKGYLWWLWVVITTDTVVYLLEPTRSAEVPRRHLGENPEGIILADRYRAYQALGLVVAFCWAHIRRDFVRVHDAYDTQKSWADGWVKRINDLFRVNDQRRQALSEPEAFANKDKEVRQAVATMAEVRDQELADPNLHQAARKALTSLRKHWDGATVFVEHPEIDMDNNESERGLRDPAMGRKNYFGCSALWSGTLMAACFTIFRTLLKNHIDPQKWLFAYFEACAQNSGKPPQDIESFLPWNLSEEQRKAWRYPKEPP